MKTVLITLAVAGLWASAPDRASAAPADDRADFRAYFENRFPNTPFNDYVNGVYAIDPALRAEWEPIEDGIPPYEFAIDQGLTLWETPFANGKTYADCFGADATRIRARSPHYDAAADTVQTLESAINQCRAANGEKPLSYRSGDIVDLAAYLAFAGRGAKINVRIDSPGAEKWYRLGKYHFYAKRGQLNLACADCHVKGAGMILRSEKLSPALGQPSHFPVYRFKSGNMVNLHRRYSGCNAQVRAKPYQLQGSEYRALEFFHTYMANDLELNGPQTRR